MKIFLRWWYRITGAKERAERIRELCIRLDGYSRHFNLHDVMMKKWRAEYGHIYDLYHGDTQP